MAPAGAGLPEPDVAALELSIANPVYQDMAIKFFDHFLHIAAAN
jgi:hypothetical protein